MLPKNNKLAVVLLTFMTIFSQIYCEEVSCVINGKRKWHAVSDKFLSVSIDPASLLKGLEVSTTAMELAQHLAPAYIRLAGCATQYINFSNDDEPFRTLSRNDSNKLLITPFMWDSFNEWMKSANLRPVLALSDKERINEAWNPTTALSLLELTDKKNISCYWQLSYDCVNKTPKQYKEELKTLRNILDAFPTSKHLWKIAGSDFKTCLPKNERPEIFRQIANDMTSVADAIILESNTTSKENFEHFVPLLKTKVPLWITIPKINRPVTFASGILWARQIGEAANKGYEVVFRQPRVYELLSETSVFWITYMHKKLMGCNVLEIKTNPFAHADVYVYAHCAKKQNKFIRRGAVAVFIVNNGTIDQTIPVKIIGSRTKHIELQSYILTSTNADSTETYLNNQKLQMNTIDTLAANLVPKVKRMNISKFLNIQIPPKSVGFFVLPTAQIPVCIREEDETNLIMEELLEDQKLEFSVANIGTQEPTRLQIAENPTSLDTLYTLMARELQTDKIYYKGMMAKPIPIRAHKISLNSNSANKTNSILVDSLNSNVVQSMGVDISSSKEKVNRPRQLQFKLNSWEKEDTDGKEVVKAHKKNVTVIINQPTKQESDKLIINEALKLSGRPKSKRFAGIESVTSRLQKLKSQHGKPDDNQAKRDINMELLSRKTGAYKANTKTNKDKINKFVEASEETQVPMPQGKVFRKEPSPGIKTAHKVIVQPKQTHWWHENKPVKPDNISKLERDFNNEPKLQFLDGDSDGIDSELDDDLRSYHTFYENIQQPKVAERSKNVRKGELWEMEAVNNNFEDTNRASPGNLYAKKLLEQIYDEKAGEETLEKLRKYFEDGRKSEHKCAESSMLSLEEEDYFGLYGDEDYDKSSVRAKRDMPTVKTNAQKRYQIVTHKHAKEMKQRKYRNKTTLENFKNKIHAKVVGNLKNNFTNLEKNIENSELRKFFSDRYEAFKSKQNRIEKHKPDEDLLAPILKEVQNRRYKSSKNSELTGPLSKRSTRDVEANPANRNNLKKNVKRDVPNIIDLGKHNPLDHKENYLRTVKDDTMVVENSINNIEEGIENLIFHFKSYENDILSTNHLEPTDLLSTLSTDRNDDESFLKLQKNLTNNITTLAPVLDHKEINNEHQNITSTAVPANKSAPAETVPVSSEIPVQFRTSVIDITTFITDEEGGNSNNSAEAAFSTNESLSDYGFNVTRLPALKQDDSIFDEFFDTIGSFFQDIQQKVSGMFKHINIFK